jgi:hypothetical protein
MAWGKKYTMSFYTPEEELCTVDFYIDGYTGDPTILNPAENAFILREYNTDDNIFKPIRGQQAEISFIANSTISISDFIGNNDNYCYIEFTYDYTPVPGVYWTGYILQEDLQEEWIDTNRVITLRATEGLGLLKSKEMLDNSGNEITGYKTFFYYLNELTRETSVLGAYYYVINSLYNDAIDDTINEPAIAQTYVDPRTFSIGDGEYEDKYTVLEKINKAWNQTLFQWKGRWYILRIEDLYSPTSTNLRIKRWYSLGFPDQWTGTTGRYDISVGNNQSIKAIEPIMLRMINRNIKKTELDFFYNYPTEFVPNQNFKRGSLQSSTSTYKRYNVNNWTTYKGTFASPTATTNAKYRQDTLNSYGVVTDSYIYMVPESTGVNWWQSEPVPIYRNDILDISFLIGVLSLLTSSIKLTVAYVYVKTGATSGYFLDDNGDWKLFNTLSTANSSLSIKFDDDNKLTADRYISKSVLSKPVPAQGNLIIVLYNPSGYKFSQLEIKYQSAFSNVTAQNIAGHKEYYTKAEDIKFNDIDQIYMSDIETNTNVYGGIVYDPGTPGTSLPLLTTPDWYRYRYNSEAFSFVRENLTAKYNFNKFNRNKIDANFYGLKQSSQPIGLINTVRFVDDDPNKIYYIANMKEINFSQGTWAATLVEVWDGDRDPETATTYATYTRDFLYK